MNSRINYASFLDLYLSVDEWARPVSKRNDQHHDSYGRLKSTHKIRAEVLDKINVQPEKQK